MKKFRGNDAVRELLLAVKSTIKYPACLAAEGSLNLTGKLPSGTPIRLKVTAMEESGLTYYGCVAELNEIKSGLAFEETFSEAIETAIIEVLWLYFLVPN